MIALNAYTEKITYEYPFQNPDLNTEKRVEELISLFTIEEKLFEQQG